MIMHRVPIQDLDQLEKAIEVLTRVGGTYQGVGSTERFLIVNDAQYQALVAAKVTTPNSTKGRSRGKSTPKSA